MKIIIVAPENDNHTVPIKWALEKAGYTVVCWAGVAWTEPEHVSLLFEDRTSVRLGPHTVEPGDSISAVRFKLSLGSTGRQPHQNNCIRNVSGVGGLAVA